MAANKVPFFTAIEDRKSIYALSASSPVPDSRIHEIVNFAIKNCPSAFNVQSARAVVLLGPQHQRLWSMADSLMQSSVPKEVYENHLKSRIQGFGAAYGSVMFFEDEEALIGLQQKNAMIAHIIPEWSDHSSGMHQFTVWTALEAEGLGCNLQHYNYSPQFSKNVLDEWKLPATWKLKAQLVFGKPEGGRARERTYMSLEERVKVFGGDGGNGLN